MVEYCGAVQLMLTNKTLTTSCLINEWKVGGCNFLLVCIRGWLMPNSLPSSPFPCVCKCECAHTHTYTNIHILPFELVMVFSLHVFHWTCERLKWQIWNVSGLLCDLRSLVNQSCGTFTDIARCQNRWWNDEQIVVHMCEKCRSDPSLAITISCTYWCCYGEIPKIFYALSL